MTNQDEKTVYTPRVNSGLNSQAGYAEYMHMLRADPATGLVDPALVNKARNQVIARNKTQNKAALGLNWIQQGPDNVGGRTRAILIDKNNSNIVYAGSVTGGLFVSKDGTLSWTPVSGMQGLLGENLAVSCITQTANGRIFFGTGATFESAFGNGGSGAIGNGVYEYVPSSGAVVPVVTNLTAPNNSLSSFWTATNAIGSYGNRLYLGTKKGLRYADLNGSGAYPTNVSGWINPIEVLPTVPEQGRVQDIDVGTDGTMLVSFGGKAYVSNGASNSFTKINSPHMVGGSRWSGAIAPSNPDVMYMLRSGPVSGVPNLTGNNLKGLSISQDRGITWAEIVPSAVSTGTPSNKDPFVQNSGTGNAQGGYDDAIAVNPGDWGHVIVGGVQLYEWKYSSGSNPIGGGWFKSATLFESAANSNYVHADKHTIVWQDANTVYVGGDGGVAKSPDAGISWQARNLGYNVTSFYDVSIAANGYILGGAQDNGTQLVSFGDFGGITPLGAIEIATGDGFDAAFSNVPGGIAYATSQNGSLTRTSGGAGSSFYDATLNALVATGNEPFHTVIENWEDRNVTTSIDSVIIPFGPAGTIINFSDTIYPGETIFAGDTIHYVSLTNGIPLTYIAPSDIIIDTPTDSIKLIDPVQNKFVVRFNNGIYLTQDAARLSVSAKWFKISNRSNIENFSFSADGNHLFMGTNNGAVIRISGLSSLTRNNTQAEWDAVLAPLESVLTITLGSVVGIDVDPHDANNVIATSGGYTTGNHVYRSTDALTTGTFTAIQGSGSTSLPKMPVYDVVIDYTDNNKVIIGTEWGVWTTDNAFSAASGSVVKWTDESGTGMTHVPVFAIEQQYLNSFESTNSGCVYLGTHGRGFYKSCDLPGIQVSVEENDFDEFGERDGFVTNLNVYPNPLNNAGTLSFNLRENVETTIKIYNLTGSLVKTIELGLKNKGEHKERFDASSLSIGSYIISLESGSERKVAKFIITR